MTKTAVEWLLDQIQQKLYIRDNVIEQAKEMEKQQIIDAYDVSWDANIKNGNDYYNQTYNK
jgi:HEPN domain-containing protein